MRILIRTKIYMITRPSNELAKRDHIGSFILLIGDPLGPWLLEKRSSAVSDG